MLNYLACHPGWRNLLAQVTALIQSLRPWPVKVAYRNGQLLVAGQPVSFSGPKTEAACAQEWRELEVSLAKEAL
jgi:hypothetical protein